MKILFISLLLIGQLGFSQSDSDEFKTITNAYRYWLQDVTLANSASMKFDKDIAEFKDAAKIMLHLFLSKNSKWKVHYRASYDQFGNEIPLLESKKQVNNKGKMETMLDSGFYFIYQGDDPSKGKRLAVSP